MIHSPDHPGDGAPAPYAAGRIRDHPVLGPLPPAAPVRFTFDGRPVDGRAPPSQVRDEGLQGRAPPQQPDVVPLVREAAGHRAADAGAGADDHQDGPHPAARAKAVA